MSWKHKKGLRNYSNIHPLLQKYVLHFITLVMFCIIFVSFSDDRHRVKLHPLLGDPNSDYINANYIDVSVILLLFSMGNIHPVSIYHTLQSHSPSLSPL